MAKQIDLLGANGIDADASGDAIGWNGGEGTLVVWATAFGGGTVTLELSPDEGTTWIAVGTETTLTANGAAGFKLAAGVQIRATLSGSAAADAVRARVFQVGR